MIKPNDKFLDDVFLTLKNYIQQSAPSTGVVKVARPEKLKSLIPSLEAEGISHEKLLDELKVIFDHSVRTIHPLFLNQLFGGFNEAAWAGEVASTLLNPTMATFEIAPALTVIEKKVVNELLEMMGFDRGEGIMVTGGSNSNLLAMLCARTEYSPSIRLTGFEHNRFRVYVSAEAHYSFDKAANITGIGTQNLVLVPSNQRGEMIPEELELIIKTDLREGYVPIMVGATFGTTVLGAFDPIIKIAKICESFKVWLHVDAAWGGGALFSKTHRHLMRGIQLADSVAFDAHKTMGTPLITSFFLTKHSGILRDANRGGGAEYLFHGYENSDWDTGTYSLQCGRRADILKFWLLWRKFGTEGLMKRTDHLFELSAFAVSELSQNPRFKLIHSHYLNVCFQVHPHHPEEDINAFTLRVRNALVKEGKAMINYAQRPDGTIFFRLVFPNHCTEKVHLSELFKLILETAYRLDIV
jgi:glutamate/tyrosine decarboxylase-like PLP-dependent enzyme